LKQAKADFDKGEYRWVAQVLKNMIMVEPENKEAKNLLADTYEQLGYQAESANWRNIYLVGASELRNGIHQDMSPINLSGIIKNMPVSDFLKLMAVKLNGPKAEGKRLTINVTLSNINQEYTVYLENSVLNYKAEKLVDNPDISITLDHLTFFGIGLGQLTPEQAVSAGLLTISGDLTLLNEFLTLFDSFDRNINIVTP
jgi:alkyl sulfatase BDS1-like metallo-beta-lactamase superfamily hydrolase